MSIVGEKALGTRIFEPDAAGVDHLVGSRCPVCTDIRFPPRALCPIDLGPTERVLLADDGVVYAAVRIELAPKGFEAPYWAGYVDLPEGVRVFARIAMDDPEDRPMHGDTVSLTIDRMGDAVQQVLGPVFRKRS